MLKSARRTVLSSCQRPCQLLSWWQPTATQLNDITEQISRKYRWNAVFQVWKIAELNCYKTKIWFNYAFQTISDISDVYYNIDIIQNRKYNSFVLYLQLFFELHTILISVLVWLKLRYIPTNIQLLN
jgi:hypothetical protein